ncbi:MAG TPA: DoxX family protein [Gemmatimonadales bacterium]
MNIALWILQAALAFMYVAGGAYKTFKVDEIAKQLHTLPHSVWRILGIVEIAGGLLLVLPPLIHWMPGIVPIAAAVLVVESLFLAVLYARKSVKLVAANPLGWAIGMAVLTAVVAYGRMNG